MARAKHLWAIAATALVVVVGAPPVVADDPTLITQTTQTTLVAPRGDRAHAAELRTELGFDASDATVQRAAIDPVA